MPQVTKKIYPINISDNRVVQRYYQVKPNANGSGTNVIYGDYYNVEEVDISFDTTPLKNATSVKLFVETNGERDSVNKNYINGYKPVKFYSFLGYAYYTSFNSSMNVQLTGNSLRELKESNGIVDFSIYCHIVSYKLSNPTNYYQNAGYIKFNVEDAVYLEYTTIEPLIKDFVVDGASIDGPIICSWKHEDVNRWTVQAILNGNVVASKSGTTETTCTFNAGELKQKGDYTFKLIATNNASVELTKEVTLTRTEPIIIALEPDNVPQNINKQINVSWTTQNQQSYKLLLDGVAYSGTTANVIALPSNTLTSGNKTMTLTITYTSAWGDVRTATKTVTFLAYGNPPNPVLDGTTIYNTALPTFTWTSSEQVGYEIKLRNSGSQDIISTGEVISADKQYTSTVTLDNNSNYTLLLRIKNQYNLWSDWVSKAFSTSFVVPNKPTLSLIATNNASIIISFNAEYSSIFNNAEVWRKTDTSDWIRIAYNLDNTFSYEDKFVGNETYYYKVRAIGVSGGISESDTLSETLGSVSPIKNFHLTNVENFNDNVVLVGNPSVRLTPNRKIVSTVFAGSKAPKIDKGVTNYKTMTLSFSVKEDTYNKLMDVADNADVLLYRDGRGRKFYCQVSSYPKVNYESGGYLSISFSIVEVAFIEGNFYSGSGNQPSLFFDGTWFFDGNRVLSGEV